MPVRKCVDYRLDSRFGCVQSLRGETGVHFVGFDSLRGGCSGCAGMRDKRLWGLPGRQRGLSGSRLSGYRCLGLRGKSRGYLEIQLEKL